MKKNTGKSNNMQEKILALAMRDKKLEATLAHLYDRSIRELKEAYAKGLNNNDPDMMRFIRHKYRTTFHMLGLTALETEVNSSRRREQHESQEAAQASIDRVSYLCDEVLSQLRQDYPWLGESPDIAK